jgi:predicted MFS family arabinose efflux permease
VRGPALPVLVLLSASSPLTLNMFLPALPRIAETFGVSYGTASLSIGGYLALTAVLSLLIGPLSDTIGRRPVALAAAALFTAASIGAALAQSFALFLAFRLGQSVMVGGIIIASAVVRDTRGEAQAAAMLGRIAAIMAVAPMVAPMLGGLLLAGFGWRANFWAYAVLGMVLLVLCWFGLPETRPDRAPGHRPRPWALLREPRFNAFAATLALSTSCFYGFLATAPLVAVAAYGMTGTALGVALGSITGGFMAGSAASGWMVPRFGLIATMLAGRVITVTGLAAGLICVAIWPNVPWLPFAFTVFIGIGNGLTAPTGNAGAMSVRPDLAGSAAGIVGALTVGAGAVLTTLGAAALPASPAAVHLLGLLLAISSASLIAALWARHLTRVK